MAFLFVSLGPQSNSPPEIPRKVPKKRRAASGHGACFLWEEASL